MRILFFLMFCLMTLGAHEVRQSDLFIDIGTQRLQLELQIPKKELSLLQPAVDTKSLQTYITQHLHVETKAGSMLALEHFASDGMGVPGDPFLHVTLSYALPTSGEHLYLRSDLLNHQVINHKIRVYLRSDFSQGAIETRLLDTLRYRHHLLAIERHTPSLLHGFGSLYVEGIRHILSGYDHLLFLTVLLMLSLLVSDAGRWNSRQGDFKGVLWRVFSIITAFTLAHSLSLIIGSFNLISLSERLIETAVALSIVASALHLYRPILRHYELALTFLFGLIHGFAFSQTLQHVGLGISEKAVAILGFNLGIESMQIATALLILPLLWYLSRYHYFERLRVATAAAVGLLATLWCIERAGNANFLSLAQSLLHYV